MNEKVDTLFQAYGDDTRYLLEPNSDAPPGSGFTWGADLSVFDTSRAPHKLISKIFIEPKVLSALGSAINIAAKDTMNAI